MTRNQRTEPTTSSAQMMKLAAGLLVVVVAVLVAVALLIGGGDETADTAVAGRARIPTSGDLREVSFAAASGSPLDRFDSTVAADPAVGQSAPTITASYFDNTEVTVALDDGTPRLLMFFAHWCPHCQDEVDTLATRFATSGLPAGVEIVAISTSVDAGAPNYPPSAWFLDAQWPLPVLRDSESNDLAAAFGLASFPFTVAVNGDGTVAARSAGQLSAAQFDALLARVG